MKPVSGMLMAAALGAMMARERQDDEDVVIRIDAKDAPDVPTITIKCDGFDDLMGGPSQAKPSKTYRVPGGGSRECARRLAKINRG